MDLMSTQKVIDLPVKIETRQSGATIQKVQLFIPQKPPVSACKSYVSFWIRVDAFLTDFVTLYVIMLVSTLILIHCLAYLTSVTLNEMAMIVFAFLLLYGLIGVWLYFSLFESSRKQATPGKLLLSIKVVGPNGSRMSFGRATGRYFSNFLSGLIIGVGYFMMGFTRKKQALHDMIADCFVIKN